MTLDGNDYMALVQELDWAAVQVSSFIPGRVRLKSEQLRDDEPLGTRIADALGKVDAITDVTVNPRTGSVLLHYDHSDLDDLPALLDRAASFGVLPEDVQVDDLKELAQAHSNGTASDFNGEVQRVFRSLNASVKEVTGGAIDLKGLAPLTLFGLGLRRLLSGGPLEPIPWFNYFWFAFTLLVTFQSEESANAAKASSPEETAHAPAVRPHPSPAQA